LHARPPAETQTTGDATCAHRQQPTREREIDTHAPVLLQSPPDKHLAPDRLRPRATRAMVACRRALLCLARHKIRRENSRGNGQRNRRSARVARLPPKFSVSYFAFVKQAFDKVLRLHGTRLAGWLLFAHVGRKD